MAAGLLPTGGARLDGRVALVTGGGQGLGQATARLLARVGAKVAVTGRTAAKLDATAAGIRAAGGVAVAVVAEVGDSQAVARSVDEATRALGPVDLLVNNAAVITPIGEPWEVDPEAWWRAFEINVGGPYLYARAVLPAMLERKGGRIVNVASNAVDLAHPRGSAYADSKAALVHWTTSLAAAVEAHGLAVFAIDPGTMPANTGMNRYLAESPEGQRYYPRFRNMAEVGGGEPPERAAQLILTLATGQADALTGRFISIHDRPDDLLAHAEAIRREGRYTLRIRR
jgi:NAD(P)-dependent dehydrogenase (short-subunit alcohol dehydrogenase family)